MKVIHCKNIEIEALKPCFDCSKLQEPRKDCPQCGGSGFVNSKTAGRSKECGRVIGFLSDLQYDLLKIDPEGAIFRCPKCPPEQRWIKVFYDKDSNGLVFKTLDKSPEFGQFENAKYENLEICEQVS